MACTLSDIERHSERLSVVCAAGVLEHGWTGYTMVYQTYGCTVCALFTKRLFEWSAGQQRESSLRLAFCHIASLGQHWPRAKCTVRGHSMVRPLCGTQSIGHRLSGAKLWYAVTAVRSCSTHNVLGSQKGPGWA